MPDDSNTVEPNLDRRPLFNILLADDEPSNLLLINRMLEQAGYDVTTAENGGVALQYLNSHEYDVGIFDMHMPVMDGIEAVKLFKEQHPNNSMPFIILTAETGSNVQKQCKKVGVNIHLEKPVTADELIKTIDNI